MITAIILIHADRNDIPGTAQELLAIQGVAEVYSVAGDWDLVAIVRVKAYEQLAEVVTQHLVKVPGIVKTTTLMAFDCYSKADLERMWSIGFTDEP